MKIPKSLRIDGKRWTVKVDDLPEDMLGLTDYPDYTITLSPNMGKEDGDEVLLHEILHACMGKEVGLYVPNDMDELVVTLLAPRLLSVLKQMGAWE